MLPLRLSLIREKKNCKQYRFPVYISVESENPKRCFGLISWPISHLRFGQSKSNYPKSIDFSLSCYAGAFYPISFVFESRTIFICMSSSGAERMHSAIRLNCVIFVSFCSGQCPSPKWVFTHAHTHACRPTHCFRATWLWLNHIKSWCVR